MRATYVSFRSGPQIDIPLLLTVMAIATLGVVNLYSATSPFIHASLGSGVGRATLYVSQIYWIVVGMLLAILVAAIDYRHYERAATVAWLAGLVLVGLVFVFGKDVRGAKRWIEIGQYFAFQPSEFMKVPVILVVARYVHNDVKTEPRTLLDLAVPFVMALIPAVAVRMQPDFGTAIIYVLTALTVLAIVRIRRRSVLWFVFCAAAAAVAVFRYGLEDFQLERIQAFWDPEKYKTGVGYHALQSQTAIGNGKVFGEGFMQGTQNQFGLLPDQYSDFPFSVFSEDWGFVGAVTLLGLYCFACIWSIHVASQAKDRFGAAVAIGVGAVLFWQVVFNVGMAVGLLPVVGIPLPLFSYGGSSTVTTLICFGLLMNVSSRR